MKLCVPIQALDGLDSAVEAHLPAAEYLLFFDTETREVEQVSLADDAPGKKRPPQFDVVLCGSVDRATKEVLAAREILAFGTEAATAAAAIAEFEAAGVRPTTDSKCAGHGHGGCGGKGKDGAGHAHRQGGGCSGHAQEGEQASGCCGGQEHAEGPAGGACGEHAQSDPPGKTHGGRACGGKSGDAAHEAHEAHEGGHGGGCGRCGKHGHGVAGQARAPLHGDASGALRVAVSSQNRRTVTDHAGRCRKFWIYEIFADKVGNKTMLELPIEQTLHASELDNNHPLADAHVLITAGMSPFLYQRLQHAGIRPFVTDESDPDKAVRMLLERVEHA